MKPGEPADRFFADLDAHNMTMRHAIVEACETFLDETLEAGIAAGVITDAQAAALKTLGAGPPDEVGARRGRHA